MVFSYLCCGHDFNSILNKDKSATPPLFRGPEMLFSVIFIWSLAKIFSKNSILHDSDISLSTFPSGTTLKQYISEATMLVKEVISNSEKSILSW